VKYPFSLEHTDRESENEKSVDPNHLVVLCDDERKGRRSVFTIILTPAQITHYHAKKSRFNAGEREGGIGGTALVKDRQHVSTLVLFLLALSPQLQLSCFC
jgi:hypothetical protein